MSDSQIMNRADLEAKGLTSEKLVEKLQSALKRDGDFPATARVVTELRRLTTDPNTSSNKVA